MAKYGRGLGREFAQAVKNSDIREPFSTKDVRDFAASRGWKPPESYINVLLANSSSGKHSKTYLKLFESLGKGMYKLSDFVKKTNV